MGAKNVVFWGMRTRSVAAARVCATETGLQRIAARAVPLSHLVGDGLGVVPVAPRGRRDAWHDQGFDHGGVGRGHGGMFAGQGPGPSIGPRDREVEAGLVRRSRSRAAAAMRSTSSSTASGEFAPHSTTSKVSSSRPTRSTSSGTSSRRWIGSMSSSSSTSSTTSIMIASAPVERLAVGSELVAVGARGLEAVVAVGEHDRVRADVRSDRGDRARDRRSHRARGRRRRHRRRWRAMCRAPAVP